jgi:hypothetical protein
VGDLLQRYGAWLLVGGAAIAALAFPTTAPGGVGFVIVAGALGIAVAEHGGRLWRRAPDLGDGVAGAIAVGLVVVGAAVVFGRVAHDELGWTMGDWGIQHAVLRDVVDGMCAGDLPGWTHALSTGDAPLETYPAVTYLVAGAGAVATGAEDLTRYLLCFAVAIHALIAVGITRLALRVAPAPVACLLGLVQLVDHGNISAGGVSGDVKWALVHNALAQAVFLVAIVAVCNAVMRPRLRSSVAIWVFTALACATHPSALLTTGAAIVALVAVAVLAADVPARRALAAAGHLAIGLGLAAVVWVPLGERLVAYGQHFPTPPRTPGDLLDGLLQWPAPATSFAPLMYLGYAGLIAGLASRRAVPVLVGALGVLLLLGLVDTPYLVLDTGPSRALARLGAERFQGLCRPFVVAGAAYAIAVGWRAIRRRWRGAGVVQRRAAAVMIALGCGLAARACAPYTAGRVASAVAEAERSADDRGEAELRAWATQQAAALAPDRFARALFELGDVHYNFHLTAETGLPSLHMEAIPNLLLRERIEDTSEASLRRFAVRWVIVADDTDAPARTDGATLESWEHPSPSKTAALLALGDPATEQRFGRYVVREVAAWDGAFARVEQGGGQVRVVRLDAERVEIELTATDQPALVALGMGYYPRWRARDAASGRAVSVYAMPSIDGGELRVPAAWVHPGRTVFTCDGELPSDGAGRGIAGVAALIALAIVVAWSRPRWRVRVLRRLARGRAWLRARRRAVVGGASAVVAVGLVVAGGVRACAVSDGLEVGVGLRGSADVSARVIGAAAWEDCGYSRLVGRYVCDGVAAVSDVIAGVVNHGQPGWSFPTPVIQIESLAGGGAVEVRVRVEARLDGTYWAATRGGVAVVQLGADAPMELGTQRTLELAGRGEVEVGIEAVVSGGPTRIAFVRRDAIDPARAFLVPPPPAPPP